jgi:hypothetical protein
VGKAGKEARGNWCIAGLGLRQLRALRSL